MSREIIDENSATTASGAELNVSADRMEVMLSCKNESLSMESLIKEIQIGLKQMKIIAKPDVTKIKEAIAKSKESGEDVTDLVIATGIRPVEPRDATMEWMGDYFNTGFHVDPVTKKIDFHQRAGDPNVEKGQLLVKIEPAVPGQDGRDVYGRAMIMPKPKDVNLKGGSNVYWDQEKGGFVTNVAGRVKMKGQTVDVDPVYFVKDGVGSESGNIKHNGQVIIDGEVDAEFKIEATGDIEIRGLTYASDIICGGNLTTKEGIRSNLDKKIIVEGEIFAKYIQNARVFAKGNITVNTEIYESNVETMNSIHCNEGRIVGGELAATKGISVGEAGSKGNVKTRLIAGVDRELMAKVKENKYEIGELVEMRKKLEAALKKSSGRVKMMNDSQKEALTEVQFKINEINDEIVRLEEEIKSIMEKVKSNKRARVTILNTAFPGVEIRICDSSYRVEHALMGPVVALYDKHKGEVVLTSKMDEDEEDKKKDDTSTQ